MKKLYLLGGGAAVTSALLLTTASAFAAAPSNMSQITSGSTNFSPRIVLHDPAGGKRVVQLRDAIAQVLGLTPDQLKTELQTKTLDQLASEHGMTRAELLQAALKQAGFSDTQIQRILNHLANHPNGQRLVMHGG